MRAESCSSSRSNVQEFCAVRTEEMSSMRSEARRNALDIHQGVKSVVVVQDEVSSVRTQSLRSGWLMTRSV